MMNFGPLTAEICWRVWGIPANFNGLHVLAALLHGTLVVGVNQTAALNRGSHLYSAGRPSRWALAHISSFNWFGVLAAVLHGTLVVGVSQTAAFNRGHHLYSAGRPSGWALAHISSYCRYCIVHCVPIKMTPKFKSIYIQHNSSEICISLTASITIYSTVQVSTKYIQPI